MVRRDSRIRTATSTVPEQLSLCVYVCCVSPPSSSILKNNRDAQLRQSHRDGFGRLRTARRPRAASRRVGRRVRLLGRRGHADRERRQRGQALEGQVERQERRDGLPQHRGHADAGPAQRPDGAQRAPRDVADRPVPAVDAVRHRRAHAIRRREGRQWHHIRRRFPGPDPLLPLHQGLPAPPLQRNVVRESGFCATNNQGAHQVGGVPSALRSTRWTVCGTRTPN